MQRAQSFPTDCLIYSNQIFDAANILLHGTFFEIVSMFSNQFFNIFKNKIICKYSQLSPCVNPSAQTMFSHVSGVGCILITWVISVKQHSDKKPLEGYDRI